MHCAHCCRTACRRMLCTSVLMCGTYAPFVYVAFNVGKVVLGKLLINILAGINHPFGIGYIPMPGEEIDGCIFLGYIVKKFLEELRIVFSVMVYPRRLDLVPCAIE